jgi:hypothetical protein
MIEAYPLAWPIGRKRTESWAREKARFDVSFARARDDITREVTLLAGRYPDPQIIISTNVPLRRDGIPLAGQRSPDDVGVAVYFIYKKQQRCFACDRWKKIEDNMRAIAKTIEALRGIARWGTGDMLEAAFTGFTALPAPNSKKHWRDVLGKDITHIDQARFMYRSLASQYHPDKGGNSKQMAEINLAWEEAQRELA